MFLIIWKASRITYVNKEPYLNSFRKTLNQAGFIKEWMKPFIQTKFKLLIIFCWRFFCIFWTFVHFQNNVWFSLVNWGPDLLHKKFLETLESKILGTPVMFLDVQDETPETADEIPGTLQKFLGTSGKFPVTLTEVTLFLVAKILELWTEFLRLQIKFLEFLTMFLELQVKFLE